MYFDKENYIRANRDQDFTSTDKDGQFKNALVIRSIGDFNFNYLQTQKQVKTREITSKIKESWF